MPRPPKDTREWTNEVVEVERDPKAWDDFLEWLAELIVTEYFKEQEIKAKAVVPPEEDPDSEFELKSD